MVATLRPLLWTARLESGTLARRLRFRSLTGQLNSGLDRLPSRRMGPCWRALGLTMFSSGRREIGISFANWRARLCSFASLRTDSALPQVAKMGSGCWILLQAATKG